MRATATAKFIRISPRKLGVVAGMVRGYSARQAMVALEHTPKRAARQLAEVVASALANAEHNHRLKAETLLVESILIGPGPTLKRFRPRARGRADRVLHRSSHITVVLTDKTERQASSVKRQADSTSESKIEQPKLTANSSKLKAKEPA